MDGATRPGVERAAAGVGPGKVSAPSHAGHAQCRVAHVAQGHDRWRVGHTNGWTGEPEAGRRESDRWCREGSDILVSENGPSRGSEPHPLRDALAGGDKASIGGNVSPARPSVGQVGHGPASNFPVSNPANVESIVSLDRSRLKSVPDFSFAFALSLL